MKIRLLDTEEDFEKLKKGDLILVKWADYWVEHTPGADKVMLYKIHENKYQDKEIICQKKNNHFFDYEMYLNIESMALEVYEVIENDI
jgi:hypothetical protein